MQKTRKLSYHFFMVLGLILLATNTGFASEQALKQELDGYINIFSGNNFAEQRKAIEPLGWSGYSTPKLYDLVADKLRALKNADSKIEKERASWYAKTLALSGNEKYRSLLQDVADNADARKLRKHAATALDRLPTYIAWNPIIRNGLSTTSMPLEEKRIRNMLGAEDLALFRLGTKRVYYANSDDTELVGLVKSRLMRDYNSVNDNDGIDAMAWAIKVLAQSGDLAHVEALDEIVANATQKKIKKYAKKYRGYF